MVHASNLSCEIRKILLEDWDPIGIGSFPDAQDEYDGYIPDIVAMLESRKKGDQIADFLLWVEAEHMGLRADPEKARTVAMKFTKLLT